MNYLDQIKARQSEVIEVSVPVLTQENTASSAKIESVASRALEGLKEKILDLAAKNVSLRNNYKDLHVKYVELVNEVDSLKKGLGINGSELGPLDEKLARNIKENPSTSDHAWYFSEDDTFVRTEEARFLVENVKIEGELKLMKLAMYAVELERGIYTSCKQASDCSNEISDSLSDATTEVGSSCWSDSSVEEMEAPKYTSMVENGLSDFNEYVEREVCNPHKGASCVARVLRDQVDFRHPIAVAQYAKKCTVLKCIEKGEIKLFNSSWAVIPYVPKIMSKWLEMLSYQSKLYRGMSLPKLGLFSMKARMSLGRYL